MKTKNLKKCIDCAKILAPQNHSGICSSCSLVWKNRKKYYKKIMKKCKCGLLMKECGFEGNNLRYECSCGLRFVPWKERYLGNNFLGYPRWSRIDEDTEIREWKVRE